ncbi:MAG: hypothetical protein CMJ72_00995 [Planctomycetaceae bacterium]|nr:hypothetical protein [Planctomycetaceae bacterium]
MRDIHAPSLIRFGMDADRVGNWAPFLVALLLLAISGWGIVNIPSQQSTVEAGSENMIPQFVEHFPMTESDVVPNDGLTRLAWHPAESNLGSMKTDDRFLELGEQSVVSHATSPANAVLQTHVSWLDGDSLNITVQVNITSEIENGILRIIVIEDNVEMFGRAPTQNSVVRLYDPTPIGDDNGTISRNLQLPNGLDIKDGGDLQVIILLSNMMTEENYAMMEMEIPTNGNGPVDNGQRVGAWLAIGIGILVLSSIARAEWKREVFLPRLRGNPGHSGVPVAHLKAGLGDIKLREVRVLPPWKLSKQIRDIELRSGAEKTFQVHLKPNRGQEGELTHYVQTEWSIEVEEMGAWVLDLTLFKEPPT